jgi:hypothetical protein
MPDVSDDELVLHRYDELDPARRAELDAALAADPALAARRRALDRTLDAASAAALPEPSADLGERMWARVAPRLGPQQPPQRLRPWLALAAAAGIAAVGIVLWSGRLPSSIGPVTPSLAATTTDAIAFTPAARERVLLTRVAHHLDGSQRLFASVSNGEGSRADLAETKAWAQRALAANRVYRNAAAGAGEKRMVALLDAMEPLLIEIANAPETLTPGELAFLQQRIDDADLLFRLRSAQKRIEGRTNRPAQTDVQTTPRSDI